MGKKIQLTGPQREAVEAEFDFFLDPFHRIELVNGSTDSVDPVTGRRLDDVVGWVDAALREATERSREPDGRFLDWVLDEVEAAAVTRLDETDSLWSSRDIGRCWDGADYGELVLPPIDGAEPSWITDPPGGTWEATAWRERMDSLRWAALAESPTGVVAVVAEGLSGSEVGEGATSAFSHYSNVQAARWINRHLLGEPAFGDRLDEWPVGNPLVMPNAIRRATGPPERIVRAWVDIVRTVRAAGWLVRPGARGRDAFALEKVYEEGPNVPNTLRDRLGDLFGVHPSTVTRRLKESGWRHPRDLTDRRPGSEGRRPHEESEDETPSTGR